MMNEKLTEFTDAYIGAAMQVCLLDDEGNSANDMGLGEEDLALRSLAAMKADCARFFTAQKDLLPDGNIRTAGQDFWLSRNGHGSGFFDGPEVYGEYADALQEAARAFGEQDLYIGDDGKLWAFGTETFPLP